MGKNWTNNPGVWKWHDLSQQSLRTCLYRRLSPFSYTSSCSLVPPAWPKLRAVLQTLIFAAVLQIIMLNITFPRWPSDTDNLKKCKHSYYAFTMFLQGIFPISPTLLSLITCSCSWYQSQSVFAWEFYQFMVPKLLLGPKLSVALGVYWKTENNMTEIRRVKSRLDKLLHTARFK